MKNRLLLLLSLLLSTLTACAPRYQFSLVAGSCLNPSGNCGDVTSGEEVDRVVSRPMKVLIYTLSSCPEGLKWDDFQEEGKTPEFVTKSQLGPLRSLVIERNEHPPVVPQELTRQARCVMVLAMGRRSGSQSLLLVKPGLFKREFSFYFDRNDVYSLDKKEPHFQKGNLP